MNKERILEIENNAAEKKISVYKYCKLNGINISSFYSSKSYYRAKEEKTNKSEIIQIKPTNSKIQYSEIKCVANSISISLDANGVNALEAILEDLKKYKQNDAPTLYIVTDYVGLRYRIRSLCQIIIVNAFLG